jgi:trimeric autotransporter adhesin
VRSIAEFSQGRRQRPSFPMQYVCKFADWICAFAVETRLLRQRTATGGKRRYGCAKSGVFLACLLLANFAVLCAQDAGSSSSEGTIRGIVKSGNMPIPGVAVTAINESTNEKATTWTNVDGTYVLRVHGFGHFVISTQMIAFAPVTQQVTVDANARDTAVNLELILESRRHPTTPAANPETARTRRPNLGTRPGFQSLSVMQNAGGEDTTGESGATALVPEGLPVPGMVESGPTESISVAGNGSNSLNSMNGTEFQQRSQENGLGGLGGGGGLGGAGIGSPGIFLGGFGGERGGRGFGRRGFDVNRPHGSIYYGIGDSALNAAPYALQGEPATNPAYVQHSFGGSIGGPLNIPKIYNGGEKTFYFVNYNGRRGESPFDQFSTVPTLLERQGNFSQTAYPSDQGQTVEIFNPATNTPFANNTIPSINPVAQGLLNYIPLPNLPGTYQNFHYVTSATNDSDDLNVRVNRSFGAGAPRGPGRRSGQRNTLTFGLHFHNSYANLTNPFPTVGGESSVRSFDVPISYTRSIGRLTNIARFDFNRSRTRTQNLYAFNQNIAGGLGITGISSNPFDWGLPNLSFTNFASLQDTNPQLSRNQTFTWSDNLIWNHGKHTWRWGGDFRRIQLNTESSSNARGSFVFTGLNTSEIVNGSPVTDTGYDFADFLLGLPQQTSVQYGAESYHFRGNSWDVYTQDEWRLRSNLTLNLGVRYEYVSPLTEINNLIANLDLSPGVLNPALGTPAVVEVLPGQTGPFSGKLPASLVRPDRNDFAPRLGFAWKPLSKTVIRGGYGINYNTGAYQNIAQQLAFQPPFSNAQTNVQTAPGELTLQNGFPAVAPGEISNNYAVNPNYRLGYVQIRNLDVQQEIRPTLLLNLDYTGAKGTDLDILEAPNRTTTGLRIPNVQAFTYENSLADLSANAATVRLRKRLSAGLSIGGLYTFSKSIDDASSIGSGATSGSASRGLGAGGTGSIGRSGGGSSSSTISTGTSNVAQDPFDLAAERGLSSFNQTHRFTADYVYELPFGHDRRWLYNSRLLSAVLGDWQWSGDCTIASGLPFTPRLLGSFTDVSRGTNGTLRPNIVPGQSIALSNPSIARWFNTAAFVAAPPGQYGDARRNSIIGPGTTSFDMAITKMFPLKEARVLEFRAQATNVFNTPQYTTIDTVVNSPTFGRVTAVGAMRQITLTSRFRF